MNIKTITCHDVYNYGASLQAYALQTFLEQNGHNVEIIDYLPDYKGRRYEWFKVDDNNKSKLSRAANKFPFLTPILGLIQHRRDFKFYKRKHEFDAFKAKFLHCTNVQYRNICDLNKNVPQADLYIAGSDQIWNTDMGNGNDASYYLDFVNDKDRCIAYAASFGIGNVGNKAPFVKNMLANFRAIAIRERKGVEIANSLGYEAVNVLDPVFLLDKEDWGKLCKNKRKKPYLLLYDFFHLNSNVEIIATKIAKEHKLEIVSVNAYMNSSYAKNVNDAGPIEFLELIKNATFVVGTSFHATAFSIIFHREFIVCTLDNKNNFRMKNLLESLEIENRFVTSIDNIPQTYINYDMVENNLVEMKKKSRKWLLENLGA